MRLLKSCITTSPLIGQGCWGCFPDIAHKIDYLLVLQPSSIRDNGSSRPTVSRRIATQTTAVCSGQGLEPKQYHTHCTSHPSFSRSSLICCLPLTQHNALLVAFKGLYRDAFRQPHESCRFVRTVSDPPPRSVMNDSIKQGHYHSIRPVRRVLYYCVRIPGGSNFILEGIDDREQSHRVWRNWFLIKTRLFNDAEEDCNSIGSPSRLKPCNALITPARDPTRMASMLDCPGSTWECTGPDDGLLQSWPTPSIVLRTSP